MISADLTSALIGAASHVRAPPVPPNLTRAVQPAPSAERSSGGSVSTNGGEPKPRRSTPAPARQAPVGPPLDLARSARTYAALLELTGDANVAALFSGFGSSLRGAGGVDLYA